MIDEKMTRKNTHKLLKEYHNFRRLSGIAINQDHNAILEQLQNIDCSVDDELNLNLNQKQIAQLIFKSIHQTLQMLSSRSRRKIEQRYILEVNPPEVWNKEMISKSTFYRQLNKSIIDFAESFKGGKLIVFEDTTSE